MLELRVWVGWVSTLGRSALVYRLCTANGNEQLTQNWYGPGESDCLIKTKHCDGDNFVLTQCDFCPVL